MYSFDFQGIQGTKDLRFVDDHIKHDMIDDAENESSDIDSLFSSVCAFCDDGGDLLWYATVLTDSYDYDGYIL